MFPPVVLRDEGEDGDGGAYDLAGQAEGVDAVKYPEGEDAALHEYGEGVGEGGFLQPS